ncbi:uroporphyrinogen-III C-methyltransferase [Bacillus sp. T3]|uniref:uroporphyrinogen-III C-methyltransferase n=1 Tax=Bacillus sp. T3 TaxID=467262 RepID=UPI002982559D|nr:uroporphyrinogen-III C-methyltransferase [Bacillus sp. T3]
MRQEKINEVLVSKALEGKRVVRLKGGDPGVFGRVGEEAEALANHKIEFEMIPGISSGMAAPLYAGIPVTHRRFGETFAIVTAHDKSVEGIPVLDWQSLANGIDTIAFYMGISNLPNICNNLIKHGKDATTPVILIQWGTFGRQKTLQGTLSTIAEKATRLNFTNPAITLVGGIVSLKNKISWFEKKPLFGRQILLVRTGVGQSELAQKLTSLGADVYEYPKWKKIDSTDNEQTLKHISEYEQILFTSPESVNDFFNLLIREKIDIREINAKIYAASTKSLQALNMRGIMADIEKDLIDDSKLLVVGDGRYIQQYEKSELLITSKLQNDDKFDPVIKLMLKEAKLDTIIFPSSQSIGVFLAEIEKGVIFSKTLLETSEIICMGEKTAQTAIANAIVPSKIIKKPNKESVIDCLLDKVSH